MTSAQASLLRALVAADRQYHARKAAGELVHSDDRGVEVGSINGVASRTARALVKHGLAEQVNIGRNSGNWVFLGSYDPFDAVE